MSYLNELMAESRQSGSSRRTRPFRRRKRRAIEIGHPGIPGANNYWFPSRLQARKAALRRATRMGPGYRVVWNSAHAIGQLPHYHVVAPDGRRVSGHFFYGRRPPRKAPKGVRQRQRYGSSHEAEYDPEADPFFGTIWDWITAKSGVEVVSRSTWGAKPAKCQKTLKLPVNYAFIHHTAGNAPTSVSDEQATMRGIQRYHQNTKGWCDIAYNFVIMPSGRIYEGRGWDRTNGATKGYNSNSLAFCWAGNYDTSSPTTASLEAGRKLLDEALRKGYLTPGFVLRGHRDVGGTACPGRYLYPKLKAIDPRP